MEITKERKEKLKKCYERILDEAEKIDEILEGSIFKDNIHELVEEQTKEFEIEIS